METQQAKHQQRQHLRATLLILSISKIHSPKCSSGTKSPTQTSHPAAAAAIPAAKEARITTNLPPAPSPDSTHRNVVELIIGNGLLHHVWLLCCPWHRDKELHEGGQRNLSLPGTSKRSHVPGARSYRAQVLGLLGGHINLISQLLLPLLLGAQRNWQTLMMCDALITMP